ncbi:MAG TPA: hypothetical protein VFS83_07825, partial [Ktedonobacterales bacterium]|nr:hypothetical protein [Ktedonobacterales bacterium]
MEIPPRFGEEFLYWFRKRTEEAWAGGYPRQRWLPGLSEEEIAGIERAWDLRFPPDYRLFLRLLHAVGEEMSADSRSRKRLVPVSKSKIVYNWLLDTKDLRRMFAWPFDGFAFDLEHNDLWLPKWGERPLTAGARRKRLREAISSAPKLIPITGHRYLLAEPLRAGNPVLSVYGLDIIIYGTDLRRFLLIEFAHLLGVDRDSVLQES